MSSTQSSAPRQPPATSPVCLCQQDSPMPSTASSSDHPRTTSRLMLSVKRTLSSRRTPDYKTPGALSTQAESTAPPHFHQFRDPGPSALPPTVEQIAMGLHLSRTPHLRQLSSSPYAFSQRNPVPLPSMRSSDPHRSSRIVSSGPPTRSSLKKPSTTITSSSSSPAVSTPFSSASASTTTITSVTPSSSNAPKSFAGIKLRMARFLPHNRSLSTPNSVMSSPVSSPRNSISGPPKKAVRFNTESSEPT